MAYDTISNARQQGFQQWAVAFNSGVSRLKDRTHENTQSQDGASTSRARPGYVGQKGDKMETTAIELKRHMDITVNIGERKTDLADEICQLSSCMAGIANGLHDMDYDGPNKNYVWIDGAACLVRDRLEDLLTALR